MKKLFVMLMMLLTLGAVSVFASGAPTDFASALPASLIPSGFWSLVGLIFGVIVTIGGIVIGIKLMRKARG